MIDSQSGANRRSLNGSPAAETTLLKATSAGLKLFIRIFGIYASLYCVTGRAQGIGQVVRFGIVPRLAHHPLYEIDPINFFCYAVLYLQTVFTSESKSAEYPHRG